MKKDYTTFMETLIAAFYVFAPQGRVGAFATLTLENGYEMLAKGYCLSAAFKTHATFGYQPINCTPQIEPLLRIYIFKLRPRVASVVVRSQDQYGSLFLTYDGSAESSSGIGALYSAFFRRTSALTTTTSTARSIIETTAARALLEGTITPAERSSVSYVNGHSSRITRDHYVRQDRARNAAEACNAVYACSAVPVDHPYVVAFGATTPSISNAESTDTSPAAATVADIPAEQCPPSPQHDPLETADWGRHHPDYENRGERITWTAAELSYITEFCVRTLRETPERRKTIVSACLAHLIVDPAARPIFHRNHILDSKRLRHGYRLVTQEVMQRAGLL